MLFSPQKLGEPLKKHQSWCDSKLTGKNPSHAFFTIRNNIFMSNISEDSCLLKASSRGKERKTLFSEQKQKPAEPFSFLQDFSPTVFRKMSLGSYYHHAPFSSCSDSFTPHLQMSEKIVKISKGKARVSATRKSFF